MPPRMRSPTFAPAAAMPDGALVSAVLAIIDRIGEMIAAIEAGEEMPAGDDSALLHALAPGAEGASAPVATQSPKGRARPRRPAHHPPFGRVARPGDEHRFRHGAGAGTSSPGACANPTSDVPVDGAFERLSSIIAEMRDAITRTRMQRIENLFVGLPRMVRDLRPSSASRSWSISRAATSSSIAK